MSENPSNPECSRHIDTRKFFLHDMVRDGFLKLHKVAGTEDVADALTKSLLVPSFHKHQAYLWGTKTPFKALHALIEGFPALCIAGG